MGMKVKDAARGNETEEFPLLFWICSICSFINVFVCSPKWWKWVRVSLRSCAAGGWQLSSPWSTWGFREESSPRLGKEKLPGWVMTLRSTLRFQECTVPLSCLLSQLPGSSLQLWDWLSTGAKNGEAPSRGKWRRKIRSTWIWGSLWAELRQSHHRNREAGEREAVALSACRFSQVLVQNGEKLPLYNRWYIVCRDLVFWILKPHI